MGFAADHACLGAALSDHRPRIMRRNDAAGEGDVASRPIGVHPGSAGATRTVSDNVTMLEDEPALAVGFATAAILVDIVLEASRNPVHVLVLATKTCDGPSHRERAADNRRLDPSEFSAGMIPASIPKIWRKSAYRMRPGVR